MRHRQRAPPPRCGTQLLPSVAPHSGGEANPPVAGHQRRSWTALHSPRALLRANKNNGGRRHIYIVAERRAARPSKGNLPARRDAHQRIVLPPRPRNDSAHASSPRQRATQMANTPAAMSQVGSKGSSLIGTPQPRRATLRDTPRCANPKCAFRWAAGRSSTPPSSPAAALAAAALAALAARPFRGRGNCSSELQPAPPDSPATSAEGDEMEAP